MLDYQLKQEFKYAGDVLNLKESKTKVKLTQFDLNQTEILEAQDLDN
jgi:hypothetical protein